MPSSPNTKPVASGEGLSADHIYYKAARPKTHFNGWAVIHDAGFYVRACPQPVEGQGTRITLSANDGITDTCAIAHDCLYLIGNRRTIEAQLLSDKDAYLLNPIDVIPDIFLGVAKYVPNARFTGLFPIHDALASLLGGVLGVSGGIAPALPTLTALQSNPFFTSLAERCGMSPDGQRAQDLIDSLGVVRDSIDFQKTSLMSKAVTKSATPAASGGNEWIVRLNWYPGETAGEVAARTPVGSGKVYFGIVRGYLMSIWDRMEGKSLAKVVA